MMVILIRSHSSVHLPVSVQAFEISKSSMSIAEVEKEKTTDYFSKNFESRSGRVCLALVFGASLLRTLQVGPGKLLPGERLLSAGSAGTHLGSSCFSNDFIWWQMNSWSRYRC